ncbi:putative short chain dehydrogenase [Rosellinia necatrix]|uniref:Putative short chain dehydrogenase n=1 Tax=Rosellinia necatrix TaxID=77044 RepID=A0A1W2TJ42_ROSNE|nr:putative short chain dehydrogenase [Rosellinia necatrix]
MPSYVVTGVSKGLGFEFLRQLSADPNNLVVGIVRGKAATEKKVAEEIGSRPNIHIVYADLTKYETIKAAAEETAKITGGSLDYLIANGAYNSLFDAYYPVSVIGEKPKELEDVALELFRTNALGQLHLFNAFTPLLLKGNVKKAIALSSAQSDLDFINDVGVEVSALYSMSKAALNVVVAKFSAQYKKEGVLFLGICPGSVDVGHYKDATPEQIQGLGGFFGALAQYAPDFKGPVSPEVAVKSIVQVWENATAEKDGGKFVSHKGNKQWL